MPARFLDVNQFGPGDPDRPGLTIRELLEMLNEMVKDDGEEVLDAMVEISVRDRGDKILDLRYITEFHFPCFTNAPILVAGPPQKGYAIQWDETISLDEAIQDLGY